MSKTVISEKQSVYSTVPADWTKDFGGVLGNMKLVIDFFFLFPFTYYLVRQWPGRPEFYPRWRHTNDSKNCT